MTLAGTTVYAWVNLHETVFGSLRGLGISIFPEFAIAPYIQSEDVVEVLPDWQVGGNYQGNIVAQYTQSKYIPKQITAFVDYIREKTQLDTRFSNFE